MQKVGGIRQQVRRLRRYLIWHLQLARAKTILTVGDVLRLVEDRVIAELAPLEGRLDDERGDKLVLQTRPLTELVVVVRTRLARIQRSMSFDPARLVEAVRSFDRKTVHEMMCTVRDLHADLLLPWRRRQS